MDDVVILSAARTPIGAFGAPAILLDGADLHRAHEVVR
jgi:acetyl-CoA acetyltransferase